ncbi:MAG: mechanosensitive ion channel family protein [Candidatus Aenigmarchaeota archaeon]|nr:mechanosensitive ion channel family protein [Candidatus Aenigmarchaeota archaeon]
MAFNIEENLSYISGNNYPQEYLVALEVFIVLIILSRVFKFVILNRLKKASAATKTELDDLPIKIIDSIGWPFYIFLSLYISLLFVKIQDYFQTAMNYILFIIVTYYTIICLQNIIDYGAKKISSKQKEEDKYVIDFSANLLKGILWAIALLFILSNLGYNISTLIAGLGIGGIAIAFAMQNVLGDIFASFSIYFDKPFKVGDFIIVGKDMGTVKKIGIKTTRIQSLGGQEIIVSNKDLTTSRVNNYKRMKKRRISFSFGVVYETTSQKLKKINQIIKDVFDKIPMAELDRVHFKEYGDFSLNYEVVYYVNTGDYNKYMDVQQEANFAIKEEFEKEGIEFAYPTQTVLVNGQK